jgi:general secretion pathway protein G
MAMRATHGFTLIEMLVAVAIVALLASIALPLSDVAAQRNKEQELRRALREVREAIDNYKRAADEGRIARSSDASGYPASLGILVQGVSDVRNPGGAKIYFLRRIPRDPFAHDPNLEPAQTWGVRSYDSPPEAPRAGRDVFDVYSLSPRVGLNGIAYREW